MLIHTTHVVFPNGYQRYLRYFFEKPTFYQNHLDFFVQKKKNILEDLISDFDI
jgi:hypothetical protein